MTVRAKALRAIAVATFAIGAMANLSLPPTGKATRFPSYVATFEVSEVQNAYDPVVVETRILKVSANGEAKMSRFGNTKTEQLYTTDGIYEIGRAGEGVLQYLGRSYSREQWNNFHSITFLENHPQFFRFGEIDGLKTYTMALEDHSVELTYSPKTGPYPLAQTMRAPGGNLYGFWAIKVEFEDLEPEQFRLPPGVIRFDTITRKADAFEADGQMAVAESLRELIHQQKERLRNEGRTVQ
jgi:hypothetical protein